ncbi:MAG: hypothetical protein QNJ03_04285 [Dinoroseobacter sp.]|nr:hypothetical protein [Dinoroseobacter sp.]
MIIVPCILLPRGLVGTTASLMLYLFLVWTLLIIFAALITRYIQKAEQSGHRPLTGDAGSDAGEGA